ncbi:hypothetical protein BOX15_Mlig002876g6, partial [Macrostomum lignano]
IMSSPKRPVANKANKSSSCTHVDMVLLSWEEIKAKQPKCEDCGKFCKGACWLCLFQDCEYVGCGSRQADHSSRHQTEEGHPLCINLRNKRFWCSKCKCEVFEHGNTPQFVLRKFAAGFENSQRGRPAAAESSSDEEAEPESLGLTGLRNLGNTCYMNAAVQALSHCRQLTRFFLDCPGLARPGRFAARSLGTPLCSAYAGLLADLWSPQRHSAVTPHLLLQSMRQAHPAFRSWAQQDTQEFLRCFMDQLHEELKRPLLLPPVGEEDDDGGGNSGNGGGGDVNSDGGASAGVADGADSTAAGAALAPGSAAPMAASPSANSLVSSTEASASAGGAATTVEDCGNADQGSVGPGEGAVKRSRIRRFNSIISDIFNGSLVSTVQCNSCESLSSTLEVFQDLSLPIPVAEQLAARQRRSSSGGGSSVSSNSSFWWLTSFLTWPLSWMRDYFVRPQVSLQDCLDAFFSNDDLKGDNMYHCAKCGKLRNGIKYSRISRLPEMLTVHLKRFRHDFAYSSKIHSHVAFPVDELDMKPYLHRDCRAAQTVYDLTAVVCHHGSTSGGHYTAFALNYAGMQWYEFDDARVRPVDVSAVECAQAYVLFYRKRDEWMQPMRVKVSEIMETEGDSSSLMPFYISRSWLNKFNTFGDPGPISNEDFLCPHHLLSPHVADYPEDVVMRLPYRAWDILMTEFGGGPTVNRLGPCPECAGDLERTRDRARQELATLTRELQHFQRAAGPGPLYCISMRWFRKWESFATEKQLEPPGPIDNSGIVLRRGNRLLPRANSDCAQVSGRMWRYFLSIYGGGPEVKIEGSSSQQRRSRSSSSSRASNGGSVSGGNDESRCSGNESETGRGTDASARAAALDADKD